MSEESKSAAAAKAASKVSQSQTGHAVNADNFAKLMTYCMNLGDRYKPSNASLQIKSLINQSRAASDAVSAVTPKKIEYRSVATKRHDMFDDIVHRSSRANSWMISNGTPDKTAAALVKKITGAKVKKDAAPEGKKEYSMYQTDMQSRLQNFRDMTSAFGVTGVYAPEAADLSLDSLRTLANDTEAAMRTVDTAFNAYASTIDTRDELLYGAQGAVAVAKRVKEYLKSTYGSSSNEYKGALKIPFKMITSK